MNASPAGQTAPPAALRARDDSSSDIRRNMSPRQPHMREHPDAGRLSHASRVGEPRGYGVENRGPSGPEPAPELATDRTAISTSLRSSAALRSTTWATPSCCKRAVSPSLL
jgi:hypothetical protein